MKDRQKAYFGKLLNEEFEWNKEAVNYLGKDQFGFRKGTGTKEATATL
jgi:hypothetical protein